MSLVVLWQNLCFLCHLLILLTVYELISKYNSGSGKSGVRRRSLDTAVHYSLIRRDLTINLIIEWVTPTVNYFIARSKLQHFGCSNELRVYVPSE